MTQRVSQRRFEPPPMNANREAAARVTVDEKVVRKMLAINPSLRKGRTTFQVKKALERGESISARQPTAAGGFGPQAAASGMLRGGVSPTPGAANRALEDTIDFFVRGKSERWVEERTVFAAQRRAIDDAEAAAREALGAELRTFVALFDDRAVAVSGRAALEKHSGLLSELGLTVQSLLAASPRGGR